MCVYGSFSLFPRLFFLSLVQGCVGKQWIIWCEFPRFLGDIVRNLHPGGRQFRLLTSCRSGCPINQLRSTIRRLTIFLRSRDHIVRMWRS